MDVWRATFVDDGEIRDIDGFDDNGLLIPKKSIRVPSKIELRDNNGQILRLEEGSTLEQVRTEVGRSLVVGGEGPAFSLVAEDKVKGRTSCWFSSADLTTPWSSYLLDPSPEQERDVCYAFNGHFNVYDFDENNRPYTICTLREGEKATIHYQSDETGPSRYESEVEPMDEEEYGRILERYVDGREWGLDRLY